MLIISIYRLTDRLPVLIGQIPTKYNTTIGQLFAHPVYNKQGQPIPLIYRIPEDMTVYVRN